MYKQYKLKLKEYTITENRYICNEYRTAAAVEASQGKYEGGMANVAQIIDQHMHEMAYMWLFASKQKKLNIVKHFEHIFS